MKNRGDNAGCPWWQTGVIYQIYPRSFRDTTGNGIGDLRGIAEQLDYLSETLGVDAIWISPFYPSPMADFGYDVTDYTGVDPLFGTLEIFDQLLNEAHQRGIRVVIDFVPNHTSDQHPWFWASRASRESPKRDWYIWADPAPGGGLPNNWLSVFGGSAWTWDARSGQYYLHSFLEEQPDLNWRNPEVQSAMLGEMRFWLDRGVDGFRLDVINYVMKDADLRDNPKGSSPSPWDFGEYARFVHRYSKDRPEALDVARMMRELTDAYPERVLIGEVYHPDVHFWASFYGDHPGSGLHLPFNFRLLLAPWKASAIRDVVDEVEGALPAWGWPNNVLGSHDVGRLASRVGPAQARVAALLLLTLRGTPTLYYGDELGMGDVPVPEERVRDPYGKRVPGASRDPCRTPMQWDAGPRAGFSPPKSTVPWLPLAGDYAEVNVAHALGDPGSMLNLYRRLLAYRRYSPALRCGEYRPVEGTPEAIFAYTRRAGEHVVLVALNFSEQEQHLALPALGEGTVVLSTRLDRTGTEELADVVLRGDEGILVKLS